MSSDRGAGTIWVELTPLRLFAGAALLASALALAFNLGRRLAHEPSEAPPAIESLESARRRPAIPHQTLEVDRGAAVESKRKGDKQ